MRNHYGDDELRSITFRDEVGEGDDRRPRPGGQPYARERGYDDPYARERGYDDPYAGERGYGGADDRDPRGYGDPGYEPRYADPGYPDPRGYDGPAGYDDRYDDRGYARSNDDRYDDRYDDRGGYGPPYDDDPRGYGDPPRSDQPRRNRAKTALLVMLALILMLGGGGLLTAYLISENVLGNAKREATFSNIDEDDRAQKPDEGPGANALNVLLAGTDARTGGEKTTGEGTDEWKSGGKRSDTIIIAHITAARDKVYLISIPRDSWVEIPEHGMNKINAAYAFGGSSLYVRTVENLTGIRIDHYAAIDWEGFMDLTDALGGVEMTFDDPTTLSSGRTVPAGTQVLSGEEALDYVRKRKGLENGDFDRIKRQQNFLRSLMRQTLSAGTLSNPLKLKDALGAVTQNLSVDEQLSNNKMRSLAWSMREIRSSDVEFLTVPVDKENATPTINGISTVALDTEQSKALFEAVKYDRTGTWIANHDADTLGEDVN